MSAVGPRFGKAERREIRSGFVQEVLTELREAYLEDTRPWIVGFSGGKDSTALMQLIYYMLGRLPAHDRRKPVHVVASDTRVEAPYISARVRRELSLLEPAAERDKLPITAHLVFPKLNDTFWVNLIGRGYPSPNNSFRWCTDRLKISPVSEFVTKMVDEQGAVVIVLGARRDESDTRAQRMNATAIDGQRYRPHADLPRAWVYTPIEALSANEVWTYLLQSHSPWGGDNRGLVALYKQASGGECPLVIDKSTQSCGHSRFGCWVCTVIDRDRSMGALVDAGEETLAPLLEIRDYLKDLRSRAGARYDHRRNGRVPFNRHTGEQMANTGPFTHGTRREILRRVLEAQRESGFTIIEGDELAMIQEIWDHEENDHPDRSSVTANAVLTTWKGVYEEKAMVSNQNGAESEMSEEDRLLSDVCEEHQVPFEMMRVLRDLEEEHRHLKRRHGLPDLMREAVRNVLRQREG